MMATEQRARLMRELSEAVYGYQQGEGFFGIRDLPGEIEQLGGAAYTYHAHEIRQALERRADIDVLRGLILVFEQLERDAT